MGTLRVAFERREPSNSGKVFGIPRFLSSITIVHEFFGVFRVTSMLSKQYQFVKGLGRAGEAGVFNVTRNGSNVERSPPRS
jgi:hypothetical protein